MKKNKPYIREMITLAILSIIYGFAVLITGQACAMTYYQPQMPAKLYKTIRKGDYL